jgi:hypothetical protein
LILFFVLHFLVNPDESDINPEDEAPIIQNEDPLPITTNVLFIAVGILCLFLCFCVYCICYKILPSFSASKETSTRNFDFHHPTIEEQKKGINQDIFVLFYIFFQIFGKICFFISDCFPLFFDKRAFSRGCTDCTQKSLFFLINLHSNYF